jgi:hypothetical protein
MAKRGRPTGIAVLFGGATSESSIWGDTVAMHYEKYRLKGLLTPC